MNTLPWSTTITWGMMTGRAAACSRRWSMLSIRRNGRADADIRMACGQPGRIGSGVTVRASSTLASTDFVVGRSTAAVTVLVATSMIPVRSTRPVNPAVQADQDVQRGGVDLHQVTGRCRGHLPERPLRAAGQRPAGARRPGRVPTVLKPAEQAVKSAP